MKTKKWLVISAFALALLLIPISALAGSSAASPTKTGGGFSRNIIDRLNITIDKTEFTFKKSNGNLYNVSFTFTAEKTEADFYGVLNSFSVNGTEYEYALFTAGENNTDYVINNTVLPASDGKTQPLSWTVTIPCKITSAGTVNGTIKIEYTSGVTKETAAPHVLKIPLTVTVE